MAKWKDIVTDAKLMPAGFSEERVKGWTGFGGGGEPSVHVGFLEVKLRAAVKPLGRPVATGIFNSPPPRSFHRRPKCAGDEDRPLSPSL
eukprot:1730112-Pyramimonas_sp.AAC.1